MIHRQVLVAPAWANHRAKPRCFGTIGKIYGDSWAVLVPIAERSRRTSRPQQFSFRGGRQLGLMAFECGRHQKKTRGCKTKSAPQQGSSCTSCHGVLLRR